MSYSGPVQRRWRAARRFAYATALTRMWRDGRVIPTFWWDGHPNFGDDLTPWLLPRYGVMPVHRRAASAHLAGVGSILEFLPPHYGGAIWGSGLLNGGEHHLPAARVLALRGPLTAERIGMRRDVPFGDPGLLVGRHMTRPRVRWEIGLVPHGHHRSNAQVAALAHSGAGRVHVINVHQTAAAAVREIAACALVLTTSLHGLVTADAFGIPAAWTVLEPALNGGDFKFRDYEAVVTPGSSRFVPFGERPTLDEAVRHARSVDPDVVADVSVGLERALAGLSEGRPLHSFPGGVLDAIRS